MHCMKSVQIKSCFWSVFSYIRTEYRKVGTRNNFVFEHFSRSDDGNKSNKVITVIILVLDRDWEISAWIFVYHKTFFANSEWYLRGFSWCAMKVKFGTYQCSRKAALDCFLLYAFKVNMFTCGWDCCSYLLVLCSLQYLTQFSSLGT